MVHIFVSSQHKFSKRFFEVKSFLIVIKANSERGGGECSLKGKQPSQTEEVICDIARKPVPKINKLKKMVGSNGTLMTMRIVRSKLRKREESSVSPVTATNVEAATQPSHYHQNNNNSSSNNHHHNHHSSSNNHQQQHHQQLENGYSVPTPVAFRQSPSSVWVFPPLPPQPNLYSYNANSQDALVHNDKTGFKGLKRQLSGRFKRLVSRKSHEPAPAIPPELKPQLKTIYVY